MQHGGSPERELTYLTLLQRQRAAAVVLTGGAIEDAQHKAAMDAKLRKLADAGTRVVLCGRPPAPETGAIALTFDNRGGGQELTEHLIGLGHRRLGYIAGPGERTTTRHRLEGHRAALASHGVEEDPRWTVHGRYDRRSGYEATVELLRRDPSLTAVVAANDSVALGACAALRESGLRIPDDVSVAGFDDLPFSIDAVPSLTTVRLPLAEAGARAGRIAMGREEAPPGDRVRTGRVDGPRLDGGPAGLKRRRAPNRPFQNEVRRQRSQPYEAAGSVGRARREWPGESG